ncbi:hypothetical protein [Actinomadura verrucosospora]|uniref:hypothetical protein n=1 Tax=Actinomadura verrucosospora TaxID=46165 RepID=UPI001563FC8B|nr:hypothetical protein [Actinomadura verrucosospora]
MAVAELYGVLAAPIGEQGANDFLDSDAGKALMALCGALALVIVVIGIVRMVNGIGRGRPGEAFKSLVFALLIGGLLFNLKLTITGVKAMSGLTEKVFTSITSVTDNSDGGGDDK